MMMKAVFIVLVSFSTYAVSLSSPQSCDFTIQSENGRPKSGNFSSPNYPQKYSGGLKCLIKFIGLPTERVQIKFVDFVLDGFSNRLTGESTGCTNDYIDIYTQIEHREHDIVDLPLQGRYCGNDRTELPYLLMSEYNILIITFDTDNDNRTARGFLGTYEFISNEPYKMGEPAAFGACGWTIDSTKKSSGFIMAPYYPAVYPDRLDCFYRFEGQPGQRIKLDFTDFDLFYGGDHCPYDSVKIHDGSSTSDPEIGIYCNRLENFVIFSSDHSLYLQFITKSGRPFRPQNYGDDRNQLRGFKAFYTFSNDFVNLGFIQGDMEHLRGTECDVRIKSRGESSGLILSPNYPDTPPPNMTCHYYIDGLVDSVNLEKVALNFSEVNLPGVAARCQDNAVYLAAFLFGQMPTSETADNYICDSNKPTNLVSKNPRLSLKFSTANLNTSQPVGFKASYKFSMDYAIVGTPASSRGGSDCHFLYLSSSTKTGKFNSPRFPSYYPNGVTCTYELIAEPKELIMLSFESFEVERISHSFGECLGDSVTALSVVPHQNGSALNVPLGKYCGNTYPGPIVSEWLSRKMVIVFKSDKDISQKGFQAKYEFLANVERFPCGGNITAGGSGEIAPPNFPLKYKTRTVCDWYIYSSNKAAQIKLKFDVLDLEGTAEEGCQGAVLRIYKSEEYKVDYELCGEEPPLDEIISEKGFIRIKFISSSKSFGKTGFKILWTEVILPDSGLQLSHINILYIIIAVVIFVLIAVLVTICVCIRRGDSKKTSKSKAKKKTNATDQHSIPELICHDRLSKAPMLPSSISTHSSFTPYEPHSVYDPKPLLNQYEPVPYDSTLSSSSYSYNTIGARPDRKYLHKHSLYDLDGCLTSL